MPSLPEFSDPPVVEVAVGIQFDAIEWMIAPRLGLVWERFKDQFPKLEQHPPLPPAIEKFGVRRSPGSTQLNFKIQTAGELTPRLWMLNEEGSELIQIQPDRFHRNWRKYQEPTRTYPRYAQHVRESFLHSLGAFRQYLIDNDLPDIRVNQCELVYVNHIRTADVWSDHRQLAKVFRGWDGTFAEPWAARLEGVDVTFRRLLRGPEEEFIGRLHVQIAPGFLKPEPPQRPEEEPVFVVTLTARGKPIGDTEMGVLNFLDLAHREIVTTFDEMTTKDMHHAWGKKK